MNTFLLALVIIVAIITAIVVIGIALVFISAKSRGRERARELQGIPVEKLEENVYRYEAEYFRFIGEENEAVREFQKLIETRDISNLNKKCNALFGMFANLERQKGRDGRPFYMDYYSEYDLQVRELYRRKMLTEKQSS